MLDVSSYPNPFSKVSFLKQKTFVFSPYRASKRAHIFKAHFQ